MSTAAITGMSWLGIVLSGISTLNIVLIVNLIRSSKERGDKAETSIKELSESIPEELEKAIGRFDKLCHERQVACSTHRIAQTENVCVKLNQYALLNDKTWEKLTKDRLSSWEKYERNMERLAKERASSWRRYEESMEKLWQVIHSHSHTTYNHSHSSDGEVVMKEA